MSAEIQKKKKLGRPRNRAAMLKVKRLKRENPKLSFEKIRLIMEGEDERKYDIKSIYRWYKFPLDENYRNVG